MAKSLKSISLKRVGNELKSPGMIIAGIIGAAMLDKYALSKISAIQEKEGNKFSKFIKPAIIALGGAVGRNFVPQSLKSVVDGVTVYGGIKAVNAATSKDVMTGLSGLEPYRELYNRPLLKEDYVLDMVYQNQQGIAQDSL